MSSSCPPQPSSVYSGPPLSSSSPSSYNGPRRANTSSTVSGAYPRELRSDTSPDVAAPPTPSSAHWLPAPPQSVAPFSSARAPLPG